MNTSENNTGRKRNYNEMQSDEQGMTNKDFNQNWMASEEELKNRKILKVVSNSIQTDINEIPKGRFSIIGGDKEGTGNFDQHEENHINTEIKKSVGSVTTTKINLSQKKLSQEEEIQKSVPATNINLNINFIHSTKRLKTEDSLLLGKPMQNNNDEKIVDINANPFLTKSSDKNNLNPFKNNFSKPFFNPFQQQKQEIPVINPPSKNPFLPTTKTNNPEPFKLTSFNNQSGQMSFNNMFPNTTSFNFNMNQAQENKNWKSDDEEDDDNKGEFNPEEELKIEGKNKSENICTFNIPKSNNVKIVKLNVGDFSVYNFEEKKYKSIGQGDFSIELTKGKGDTVVAMCVLRNATFQNLFTGSIMKNITTHEIKISNFKFYTLIQKLVVFNPITKKNEPKSVRLLINSENDCEKFKDEFIKTIEILEKNDVSIFSKDDNEVNVRNSVESSSNKQNQSVSEDNKEKTPNKSE